MIIDLILLSYGYNDDERKKASFIYEHYREDMLKYCRDIIGKSYDEEDVVQNVFLKMISDRSILNVDISNDTKARSYLCIKARWMAIDMYRHDINLADENPDEQNISDDIYIDPAELVENKDGYDIIIKTIHDLKFIYRSVIELRYICNRTPEEIASDLSIDLSLVYKRLSRARQLLKEKLDGKN